MKFAFGILKLYLTVTKSMAMNSSIVRVAIIVYALAIAMFGINHFLQPVFIGQIVPDWVPGTGKTWAYITGICLLLAAIAFIINRYVKAAGLLLALFLLLIAFTVHLPPVLEADHGMLRVPALGQLQKDLAMAAGALMIAFKGN
jgi:uncharacterized membrane protein